MEAGLQVPGQRALSELVDRGGVLVLSGAGLSTESGIPDYRGPTGLARGGSPMTYQVFTGDVQARRRYWARSHLGWRQIGDAQPNEGHHAVAALQQAGRLSGVITQNVDGLHAGAGASNVLELHGSLHRVVCLSCGELSARTALEQRLVTANRAWHAGRGELRPDGDVELDEAAAARFSPVDCAACGGVLKPDVVFFGETVPPGRVARSFALVEAASALLVLGSSLTVMSGYRFVLRAAKLGTPVVIVNQGPTRGDAAASLRIDAPLGQVLSGLLTSSA